MMRSLVIVFASLSFATHLKAMEVEEPPFQLQEKSRWHTNTETGEEEPEPDGETEVFPERVGGAPERIRKALCPKGVKISGINKRALGCTVSDIFGQKKLSPEYIKKLKAWAADVAAQASEDDPDGFRPDISADAELEEHSHSAVDKMYEEVTAGPAPDLDEKWNDERFGKELIPDPISIPEEVKIFQAREIAPTPVEEAEEEAQSSADMFEDPGLKVSVEIPQEELPWNVQAAPKDVGTATTTVNPYLQEKQDKIDSSLLPWSEDFKKPVKPPPKEEDHDHDDHDH